VIAIVNMRGVKETGAVFMLPTFLVCGHAADDDRRGCVSRLSAARSSDRLRTGSAAAAGGRRRQAGEVLYEVAADLYLLMKAFSNGCAAMTGVSRRYRTA
jgi:hypothetical protein